MITVQKMEYIRDYIHVPDLADIHIKSLDYLFKGKNYLY